MCMLCACCSMFLLCGGACFDVCTCSVWVDGLSGEQGMLFQSRVKNSRVTPQTNYSHFGIWYCISDIVFEDPLL